VLPEPRKSTAPVPGARNLFILKAYGRNHFGRSDCRYSRSGRCGREIDSIAVARHVSLERALADLLRDAIAAYEDRRVAFLDLGDRFQQSTDPAETDQLRSELAQMTFAD